MCLSFPANDSIISGLFATCIYLSWYLFSPPPPRAGQLGRCPLTSVWEGATPPGAAPILGSLRGRGTWLLPHGQGLLSAGWRGGTGLENLVGPPLPMASDTTRASGPPFPRLGGHWQNPMVYGHLVMATGNVPSRDRCPHGEGRGTGLQHCPNPQEGFGCTQR